jgi:hypothetical protein
MDRPWEELIPIAARGDHAELVDSDVGEHVRTRPGEGYTPPGGGRPTGRVHDDAPIPYHQGKHDTEFGIRDSEELNFSPLPERSADGVPKQPAEFEAAWQDRYLERTKNQGKATSHVAHLDSQQDRPKLILPAGVGGDAEIGSMMAELEKMKSAVEQKIAEKKAAAQAAIADTHKHGLGSTVCVFLNLDSGATAAEIKTVHCLQPFDASYVKLDARVALTMIQAALK